ncbi:MAG: hypothetical protein QXX56_01795 [Candidatus Bathyarchaeia archaeon]
MMIFLPRASLPPKLQIIVRKVGEKDYEITTEPKLEPMVFATFVVTFKQCAKNCVVKLSGGKLNLSGEAPDFKTILDCISSQSPIPVELQMV